MCGPSIEHEIPTRKNNPKKTMSSWLFSTLSRFYNIGIPCLVLVCPVVLSMFLYIQLGTFEGGPSAKSQPQPDDLAAIPVWKNSNLTIANKMIEYVFPLVAPVGTVTKCPLYPAPLNDECMYAARNSIQKVNEGEWTSDTVPWKTTHTETIVTIPRRRSGRRNSDNDNDNDNLVVHLLVPNMDDEQEDQKGNSNPSPLEDAPFVLWMHGGGFTLGSGMDGGYLPNLVKALYENNSTKNYSTTESQQQEKMAKNIIWASVDYRLAPEHPYPAAPEDCYLALEYLTQHYKHSINRIKNKDDDTTNTTTVQVQFGAGKGGIHVAGVSAGGTLAAGTVLRALKKGKVSVDSLFVDVPVFPTSPSKFSLDSPSAQRMAWTRLCPVQFLRWCMAAYANCQPREEVDVIENLPALPSSTSHSNFEYCEDDTHSRVYDGAMSVEEWKKAAKQNNGNLPPMLLLTAKADPLHDGGIAFKEVYQQALVESSTTPQKRGKDDNNTPRLVTHVDSKASHAATYMFDPEATQTVITHWVTTLFKKQNH